MIFQKVSFIIIQEIIRNQLKIMDDYKIIVGDRKTIKINYKKIINSFENTMYSV